MSTTTRKTRGDTLTHTDSHQKKGGQTACLVITDLRWRRKKYKLKCPYYTCCAVVALFVGRRAAAGPFFSFSTPWFRHLECV